jgi:hypothetical protein
LALVLLVATLPGLEMRPGRELAILDSFGAAGQQFTPIPMSETILRLLLLLVRLAICLLPLLVLYVLFSPRLRRRLFKQLLISSLIFWAFYRFLLSNAMPLDGELETAPAPVPRAGQFAGSPGQVDGTPPSWLVDLAAVAIAVGLAALLVILATIVWRRLNRSTGPLPGLEDQATAALRSLRQGEDPSNVIIRCYRDMSRAVQRHRGLRRDTAMTPREFEAALVKWGLPAQAVGALTRLFEQVRYGGKPLAAGQEQLAIQSLQSVLSACQVKKP